MNMPQLPSHTWLWCFHCNRFFQARQQRTDPRLDVERRCAFCDTGGSDIFVWQPCAHIEQPPQSRPMAAC